MRPDFITSISKVKCEGWPGNVPLRHLPVSFALLHQFVKLWRPDCAYWPYSAWHHHRRNLLYTDLIGTVWVAMALKQKKREKLRRRVLFHQDNAPTHTSSQVLAAIRNAGLELFRHPPYSTDLAPTDFYFLNWRNSWKNANLLMMKMLSAPQMADWKSKISNSSTMESELWRNAGPSAFQLQIMLKSDKI